MVIAVASGKGGTGKTTVSVNLASVIKGKVQLLDCDVEEPNADLFLKTRGHETEIVSLPVPELCESLCVNCCSCVEFCQFNALVSLAGKVVAFPELCHSCGGCIEICPNNALKETQKRIGTKSKSKSGNISLVQGVLDVSSPLVPPLIHSVKKELKQNQIVILDAPPGASCPLIATVNDADVIVLVTEPTPFGLNDLILIVDAIKPLGHPFGVVINRDNNIFKGVEEFCSKEKIPVLMKIPEDRKIAEAYSNGQIIVSVLTEYRERFRTLMEKIKELYNLRSCH